MEMTTTQHQPDVYELDLLDLLTTEEQAVYQLELSRAAAEYLIEAGR